MSTLAFFPWLNIPEASAIGRFHLVPYIRGKSSTTSVQASPKEIDHVLGCYFETAKTPVRTATLLRLGKGAICRDFSAKDIDEAFVFSELLAFCGLSEREFFGLANFEYVNRDLYRLVIQRFQGLGGVAITTRRRDGTTSAFVVADAYRVTKPEHVHLPIKPMIDAPLMKALHRAWRKMPREQWKTLYGAILSFNLANTDNNEISQAMEIILVNTSIEQLLEVKSNIEDVAKRFTLAVVPKNSLSASLKPKVRKAKEKGRFKQVRWLREAWIRDFFAFRGHVAHRSHADQYPAIWSLKEHLLLSSFVVPLLVKRKLENLGHYVLNKDDRIKVDVFEKLCSRNLFERPDNGQEWPWRKVIGKATSEDWWNSNKKTLLREIQHRLVQRKTRTK